MKWVLLAALAFVMFNFASGAMTLLIPEFNHAIPGNLNPLDPGVNATTDMSGLTYDNSYNDLTNLTQSVKPQGLVQDATSATSRLMDLLHISLISKFFTWLSTTFFGFPTLMESLFGSYLITANGAGIHDMIFGALYWATGIAYVILGILMWTGRSLVWL
jgi:hypothetical protein